MSIENLLSALIAQQKETNRLLAASLQREEWVSIPEAANRLNVSCDTVRRRITAKEWPAQRVGRSWRVNVNAISGATSG